MPPALYSRFDPHARTGFVDEPWLLHLAQRRPVRAPRATTGRRMGMMRTPWRRAIDRTRARLLRIYEGRRSCVCPKPTEIDACRLRWHPRGRRGGVGHATARALSSSPPAAGHLLPPDGRRSTPHPPVPTPRAGARAVQAQDCGAPPAEGDPYRHTAVTCTTILPRRRPVRPNS
jgi:hypothetical protein